MTKEKNFVSAVVYVHNAENRIEVFLEKIISVLRTNFENAEIICVNDGSSDHSVEMIKKICENMTEEISISVVHMSYFHGLELSMNAGTDLAIGDFVFEFDTTILDFSEEEIMKVYFRALEGFDVVSASPERKQRLTSRLFYVVFRKFTTYQYDITTESFRILSRRLLNRVKSMNRNVPYRKAAYANAGLKTDTLKYKIIIDENNVKKDRMERKYRASLATESLILYTEVGYSFAKFTTLTMVFVAIFMAVYSVAIYMIGTPVEGWTTTILFLSFCFFGLFGILTIIIKYLQILVNLTLKRKRYSFENIEKLN